MNAVCSNELAAMVAFMKNNKLGRKGKLPCGSPYIAIATLT
jgi:hypothetical protein